MWFKAVLVVLAAVVVYHEAAVPPAGKCRNGITPIPVPFNSVRIMYKYRKGLYVPDAEEYSTVVSFTRKIISTSPDVVVYTVEVRGKENTVLYRHSYVLTYGDDHIIYEEATDYENNEKSYFKWIPIALTSELGLLYYRCSDTNATMNIDTRFIYTPKGNKFAAADAKYLLDADKKINFKGGLRKLDNKFD